MTNLVQDLTSCLFLPPNYKIDKVSASKEQDDSGLGFSSSLKRLTVHLVPYDAFSSKQVEKSISSDTPVEESTSAVTDYEDESHIQNGGQIHLVVKCMPDPSEWVALNSQASFQKEFDMYTLMLPVYRTIMKYLTGQGSCSDNSLFAKFYGAKLNLGHQIGVVDENAMILLEDLKQSGYENCERSKLDGYLFKLVLDKAALLHAVGIIIQNDPKYKHHIQNLMKTTKPFFFGAKDKNIAKVNAERRLKTMNVVERFGYADSVNEKILQVLIKTDSKTLEAPKTAYYSLIHNDLWINNIMFKYDKTRELVENLKFIDFQNTNFGSVAKEFAYLFYTSVDHKVWQDLDLYIIHYHEQLMKYLKAHFEGLAFSFSDYSLEKFREELKVYTCHKLKHIFIVTRILSGQDEVLYESTLKRILDHCVKNHFLSNPIK